jgi:hypothetical protein
MVRYSRYIWVVALENKGVTNFILTPLDEEILGFSQQPPSAGGSVQSSVEIALFKYSHKLGRMTPPAQ